MSRLSLSAASRGTVSLDARSPGQPQAGAVVERALEPDAGSAGTPEAGSAGTPQSAAVTVRGLRKSYGALEAIAGLDLTIREGEIFALLGPNGAGKTTTVEILEGYRRRSAGQVTVLGFDPERGERALKERIGIVLQSTGVERYLTVAEVIDLYRGYYPHPRLRDELLALVDLTDRAGVRVGKLSGGQRRRLDLAIGLAGDPEIIFLDEPTTGFDPNARRQAWEVVKSLTSLGRTVLLTTHFMDEAQYLADRLAVMVAGRIVAEGTPEDIVARGSAVTIVRVRLPAGAPPLPADLHPVATGESTVSGGAPPPGDGSRYGHGSAPDAAPAPDSGREFHTLEPTAFVHRLTGWALSAGIALEDFSVARPSLEDTYLALTTAVSSAAEASAASATSITADPTETASP